MAETVVTDEQVKANRTLRRLVIGTGVALLLLGIYISIFLIPDVLETVGGPQRLTMDQAADVANPERTYASVEGGTWDCDTQEFVRGLSGSRVMYGLPSSRLREETKFTEIFYTGDDNRVVMLVTLSGEVDCDEFADQVPTGYLYAMSDGTRQELTNEARLARYFMTDTFLEFCGYCGQDNSIIGAIFGVVLFLCGVGLVVFGRRIKADVKQKR